MKRVLAIAAFAAILAGCAKEIDNQIVESTNTEEVSKVAKVVLHASIPEMDTKVSTDNAGAYKWQAGDKVTVLNTSGAPYEFDTEVGGTAVDFASTTFDGELSTEAFYPASAKHASGKFYLEPSITWTSDSSLMPMLGTVDPSELSASFQSAGAVIKLICYNVDKDADKLVVTSDSKQIVGQFTPSGSPKVITASASAENKVFTINFATAAAARNMVFYIPLPTGNVGTLTFEIKAGSTVKYTKTTKAAVELGRNTVVVPSALDCVAVADALLTNEEILASSIEGSYGTGSITSSSGTWNYNACTQTYKDISKTYIQIRNNATVSYLQLPSFEKNISSITLHAVANGSNNAYTGSVYLRDAANNDADPIASAICAVGAREDFVLNVPSGYKTGYIMSSGPCRFYSVTVKFEKVGSFPSLTPADDELTIAVGSTNASTTITYANKVDDLDIAVSSSEAWLTPIITGSYPTYTLTATASGVNNGAADRSATVTLKASGVKQTVSITQTSCLVPNPTVTATAGDAKFTATWAGVPHATSYVAYLHTAPTATPATGGTDISANITGSGPYSITDYAVTNDVHYYLYVKVNGVESNYEAVTDYVVSDFTPEEAKGTSSNPYTVAEAQSIISGYSSGSGGASSVYTSGIVVSVTSISSGKLTYYISDDGTTTGQLKVYNGKGLSNADFSATSDLEAGDQVVIYGQLYNYSGTPEINSGNYLYSLTKVHKVVLDPDTDILMGGAANSVYTMTITTNYAWTATLNPAAIAARGTNFDVLNSSDVVIDGAISGSAGTTTIKFKAKGDGNGDGSSITDFGTITISDGTASGTKSIKQSPKILVTVATINFGSADGSTKIQGSSSSGTGTVTYTDTGTDNQGNTWTITTVTKNTKSFTQSSSYSQVGASNKGVSSITLTTTLPASKDITAMSAKVGGFSGTAGSVTLKVGDTTIGTGSLDAANDVTVSNSTTASGTVLTVTITPSSNKGVKVYYVSVSYK